jgi:hypothetical protein
MQARHNLSPADLGLNVTIHLSLKKPNNIAWVVGCSLSLCMQQMSPCPAVKYLNVAREGRQLWCATAFKLCSDHDVESLLNAKHTVTTSPQARQIFSMELRENNFKNITHHRRAIWAPGRSWKKLSSYSGRCLRFVEPLCLFVPSTATIDSIYPQPYRSPARVPNSNLLVLDYVSEHNHS